MSEELTIVQNLIYEIRGQKVMLDFDLARLYQVSTGALNQAVKRNIERFPADFMFHLTGEEVQNMMSQFVISSKRKTSAPPFAFTEQGVAMQQEENLAAVNDLSEDVRQDIDNLYLAIGELSSRMEEKKQEPRRKIGFQQNIED
jgi:hypothetical protein